MCSFLARNHKSVTSISGLFVYLIIFLYFFYVIHTLFKLCFHCYKLIVGFIYEL